ncbi:MAG TPA: hypothetical protein VKV28_16485 [Candidatus Binataceae bacterium]|nr:hypothetical protein [Candidatus Binataceae bacterium]
MKKSRITRIALALLLSGTIIGLSGCFAGPGYYPGPAPYAYHYGGWGRPGWGWGRPGWGGPGWGWGGHGWGGHDWDRD